MPNNGQSFSFWLVSRIWTYSAGHHTGQRPLEKAAIKGLTEDRARLLAQSDHKPLASWRQSQKLLRDIEDTCRNIADIWPNIYWKPEEANLLRSRRAFVHALEALSSADCESSAFLYPRRGFGDQMEGGSAWAFAAMAT